jgi:hypothetical protein
MLAGSSAAAAASTPLAAEDVEAAAGVVALEPEDGLDADLLLLLQAAMSSPPAQAMAMVLVAA